MYEFLQSSDFLTCRQHQQHYRFLDLPLDNPSWEDILFHFNRNIVAKAKVQTMLNLGFVYFDAEKMPPVMALVKEIQKMTTNKVTAHCYLSFLEISKTFGRHNDHSEVFFWQVQGKTRWVVEDHDRIFEYELKPNDLIYIPKFMNHDVRPLTPRAGISIGIDPC
jgi:ribosomal protein L16 Arg81 hydroxylase